MKIIYFTFSFFAFLSIFANFSSSSNFCKIENDIDEMFKTGKSYYNGESVLQSYFIAAECFKVAAYKGHPHAQYNLAGMYLNGEGLEKQNHDLAMKWLVAAAMQDHERAKIILGKFCRMNQNPVASSFIPCMLSGEKLTLFDEMMSDLGTNDDGNTSLRLTLDEEINPSIRYSFVHIYQEFLKIRENISIINCPGALITCLNFINTHFDESSDPVFIRVVSFNEQSFICFGEDNVENIDSLIVPFRSMKRHFNNVYPTINILIAEEKEKNLENSTDIITYLLNLRKLTNALINDIEDNIVLGAANRNKNFLDTYRKVMKFPDLI